MKILAVAPHPDDETLGCGGTLARHCANSDDVTLVWLTSGEAGAGDRPREQAVALREAEAREAAGVLGVKKWEFLRLPDSGLPARVADAATKLAAIIASESPDTIFAPHSGELHPDHMAARNATERAIDLVGQDISVCGYEVWTPLSWHNLVWPIDDFMEQKIEAVRCYRSQLAHYRLEDAVRGLGAYRGALAASCRYAEVFQCN